MNKIIIAGSRNFHDYNYLKEQLYKHFDGVFTDIEIVSGAAPGVDTLGEQFAEEHNIPVTQFPADWKKFGRAAGPKRNQQMAEYANTLIAFWDGKSPGTKSMIQLAEKKGLKVHIIPLPV